MQIYQLDDEKFYIDSNTIKDIIDSVIDTDLTTEELIDLNDIAGIFNVCVSSYKYIVHISKIIHRTVYFQIKIWPIKTDQNQPVSNKILSFILPTLDNEVIHVASKKPLRIFRYVVCCPKLKINESESDIDKL